MSQKPPRSTTSLRSRVLSGQARRKKLREEAQAQSRISLKSTGSTFKSTVSIQASDEEDQCVKPVTGFTRFQRSVRKIWQTELSENIPEDDQERQFKTTIRELVIYLAFVIILCIVGFCMLDPMMFYFTKVLKGLFVDSNGEEFNGISTHKSFFDYATGTLLDGLYWEQYYDGKDVDDNEIKYIYFENKILGLPRIRQIRVKKDTCVIAEQFTKMIKTCLGPYTIEDEDKETFGIGNGTAWEYSNETRLNGLGVQGRFTHYGGGAFYELLGPDKFQSKKKIEFLQENLWLDRQTRAVIIDISVYNANINMFCIMTLILEFPPTGAAVPYYQFNTLKLLRYVTTLDHFVMACEGILVIFLIYYIVEEIIEMKTLRWDYFSHAWNWIDMTLIMLVFGTLVFNLYRTFNVSTKLKIILDGYDTDYANFEELSSQQQTYNDIIAVTLFIAWLKVFKYISFNQTLNELQNTLSTCASDMAAFSAMFFLVFLAYAQWGYLLFGYMVHDFRTYFDSVFALFRVILGDFDFVAITGANRTMGPVFFISYVFVIFFIMLNMFLAILFDTYAEVKEEMGEVDEDKFGVGDLFSQGMDKMVSKLAKKKENLADIQSAIGNADKNADTKIDFEEWKAELTARGHSAEEIEDLFNKYDLQGDGFLDLEEQLNMKNDLDDQEREIMKELLEATKAKSDAVKMNGSRLSIRSGTSEEDEEETEQFVTGEEIDDLADRIEKAEDDVEDIINKIDAALLKLEAMDKIVLPGRESMGRILENMYKTPGSRKSSGASRRSKLSIQGRSKVSVNSGKSLSSVKED